MQQPSSVSCTLTMRMDVASRSRQDCTVMACSSTLLFMFVCGRVRFSLALFDSQCSVGSSLTKCLVGSGIYI